MDLLTAVMYKKHMDNCLSVCFSLSTYCVIISYQNKGTQTGRQAQSLI